MAGATIIIFGAAVRPDGAPSTALRRRVEAAARFGEGLADTPFYIPTGAVGRHGPAEAEVMAALLRALGVPAERIIEERTGTDTLSSVRACAAILRARGHRGPVVAASHAYHLPRCRLLLRMAGWPARGVASEGPASARWSRRWYWRLREVPAVPYDAALMLWHGLTTPRRQGPHPDPP
ncbi:MAG TPA: YdcF family protein [Acetobacteraceae bacterium]|nr:YdcF family protein [Acetobacteraceae bacterium]